MKSIVLLVLLVFVTGCTSMSSTEAREVAYERLSALEDGPSMHGAALRSRLQVTEHKNGKFLVELRDESRGLLWAVIVSPSGQSEISRMAIDGEPA